MKSHRPPLPKGGNAADFRLFEIMSRNKMEKPGGGRALPGLSQAGLHRIGARER
jgi:hypothetical protein